MFLLMRYPQLNDITPIVDLADMIRRLFHLFIFIYLILTILNLFRGVLDTGAHIGASKNSSQVFNPPSFDLLVDKYL